MGLNRREAIVSFCTLSLATSTIAQTAEKSNTILTNEQRIGILTKLGLLEKSKEQKYRNEFAEFDRQLQGLLARNNVFSNVNIRNRAAELIPRVKLFHEDNTLNILGLSVFNSANNGTPINTFLKEFTYKPHETGAQELFGLIGACGSFDSIVKALKELK